MTLKLEREKGKARKGSEGGKEEEEEEEEGMGHELIPEECA